MSSRLAIGAPAAGRRALVRQETSGLTKMTSSRKVTLDLQMQATAQAMRFAEFDGSDQKLDWDEWYCMLTSTPELRNTYSVADIRGWFDIADADGNGEISVCEFFCFTLGHLASQHGVNAIRDLFRRYDSNKSGVLDMAEFERMAASMGFGGGAIKIFRELDDDDSGQLSYREFLEELLRRHTTLSEETEERLGRGMTSMTHASMTRVADQREADTTSWRITARDVQGVKLQMQQQVAESGMPVADVLRLLDVDACTERSVDNLEFFSGLKQHFGYGGSVLLSNEIFDAIDVDRGGTIGFDELYEFLKGRRHSLDRRTGAGMLKRTGAQAPLSLPRGATYTLEDLVWTTDTLRALLALTLEDHGISSATVVRAWDATKDGELNRTEFLSNLRTTFFSATPSLDKLWRSEVKAVADDAFVEIAGRHSTGTAVEWRIHRPAVGKDLFERHADIVELEGWLTKANVDAGTFAPALKPKKRAEEAGPPGMAASQSLPDLHGGLAPGAATKLRFQLSSYSPAPPYMRKTASRTHHTAHRSEHALSEAVSGFLRADRDAVSRQSRRERVPSLAPAFARSTTLPALVPRSAAFDRSTTPASERHPPPPPVDLFPSPALLEEFAPVAAAPTAPPPPPITSCVAQARSPGGASAVSFAPAPALAQTASAASLLHESQPLHPRPRPRRVVKPVLHPIRPLDLPGTCFIRPAERASMTGVKLVQLLGEGADEVLASAENGYAHLCVLLDDAYLQESSSNSKLKVPARTVRDLSRRLCRAYNELGLGCLEAGQLDTAHALLLRARECSPSTRNAPLTITTLANLGLCWLRRGQPSTAVTTLAEARRLDEASSSDHVPDKEHAGDSFKNDRAQHQEAPSLKLSVDARMKLRLNLCTALGRLGRHTDALSAAEAAEKLAISQQAEDADPVQRALALHNISVCHEHLRQPVPARAAAREALELARAHLPAEDPLLRRLDSVVRSLEGA